MRDTKKLVDKGRKRDSGTSRVVHGTRVFLVFEGISLVATGFKGILAASNSTDLHNDEKMLESQVDLFNQSGRDLNTFLDNNSVNPEFLRGEKFDQLLEYVWSGGGTRFEMNKDGTFSVVNEGVISLGETILRELGKSRKENTRLLLEKWKNSTEVSK